MSKKKETHQDQFENVENALSKTEHYIEENQKSLTIIVVATVVNRKNNRETRNKPVEAIVETVDEENIRLKEKLEKDKKRVGRY